MVTGGKYQQSLNIISQLMNQSIDQKKYQLENMTHYSIVRITLEVTQILHHNTIAFKTNRHI